MAATSARTAGSPPTNWSGSPPSPVCRGRPGSSKIGCGSGGPALFLARRSGSSVTGVDISEPGIAAANAQAEAAGLGERTRFLRLDGSGRLPFDDGGFDAVLCIDAINHLPDRAGFSPNGAGFSGRAAH